MPPFAPSSAPAEAPERQAARRWFVLATGSLIVAGLLALFLVVARLPPLSGLVGDPAFFKRCLVVHVDLSLVVWFTAFITGQSFLLTPRRKSSRRSRAGIWLGVSGVALLLLSAAAPSAQPILANYVPVIDHWSFGLGLVVFAAGVLLSITDGRLLPGAFVGEPTVLSLPGAARTGLRAALLALLLAALTFAHSYAAISPGATSATRYELAHWGGGHVLQLATSAAMLASWITLVSRVIGRSPLSRPQAAVIFGLMILPWLSAPALALAGTEDARARQIFTELMRFGIFPAVLAVFLACVRALVQARREVRSFTDGRLLGFYASAGLSALGYVLGALIRGSSTMVPAHYHACIGAVTVAFMTLSFEWAPPLGLDLPDGKLARAVKRYQPALFGVGQSVFALGFALAGAHGAGRKVYGAEQHVRSTSEALGLVVMGVGGALAIVAGVAFLSLLAAAWAAASGGHHVRTPLAPHPPLATRSR